MNLRRALLAGAAYGASGFAAGFVLGALRVTQVVPRIGVFAAVALETPLMLAVGVLLARRLAFGSHAERAVTGASGLAVLIALEMALAVVLGTSATAWLHSLLTPAGALGFAGQIVFALLPLAMPRLRA